MSGLSLRGITWNHSRALPPLVAAAQRFEELHLQLRIVWEKRSLDEFGHAGLAELARTYDLIVIDHPMLGDAHRNQTLLDLQTLLPAKEIAALNRDALGSCLESYRYQDCLYAVPIDAAAPAASFRPDLLDRSGHAVPRAWDDVVELARKGLARMPGFGADVFLNLMGMCVSRGSFVAAGDLLFDHTIATQCLEELRELAAMMPDSIYRMNPIALYEAMSSSDEFAYCPFAYTYSNYSRPGFASRTLLYSDPVQLRGGAALRTVLGGTGIAISAQCDHPTAAAEFCLFVSGGECQRTLYGVCGGQPASAGAWSDPLLNEISGQFFARTVASVKTAHLRPRYPGYVELQRAAGAPVIDCLRNGISTEQSLQRLDHLYRRSLVTFENHAEVLS